MIAATIVAAQALLPGDTTTAGKPSDYFFFLPRFFAFFFAMVAP